MKMMILIDDLSISYFISASKMYVPKTQSTIANRSRNYGGLFVVHVASTALTVVNATFIHSFYD